MTVRFLRAFTPSIIIPPIICRYMFVTRNDDRVCMTRLVIMISTIILPRGPAPNTASKFVNIAYEMTKLRCVPESNNFRSKDRYKNSNRDTPEYTTQRDGYEFCHTIPIVLFQRKGLRYMGSIPTFTRATSAMKTIRANLASRRPSVITCARRSKRDMTVTVF